MKSIVFIGSGNLATHLSVALKDACYDIKQVYSPNFCHAVELSEKIKSEAIADLALLSKDADVYIVSVKDDAISSVAEVLKNVNPNSVVIHTAGSVPLSVLSSRILHSAVLYPMQTFTKNRKVDFHEIPCFIEYSDIIAAQVVKELASSISTKIVEIDSEKRRKLHLAAVFASNMVNHCYRLAERIVKAESLDFSLFYPLMNETTAKAQIMSPKEAQTGPMVRHDVTVMEAQKSLLDDELSKKLYDIMAESIYADKNT